MHKAFAKRDRTTLRALCDTALEFRPVDGLGLVGDALHGLEASCEWVGRREEEGHQITIWLRTIEEVGAEQVLSVGVVSERGRAGRGYAAIVAWICTVRDGRLVSVCGYPSEDSARRSLNGLQ